MSDISIESDNKSNYNFFFEDSSMSNESFVNESNFIMDILTDGVLNYKLKMEDSKNNSKTSNDNTSSENNLSFSKNEEDYFDKYEQINEIKYIFFMILKNNCSYDNEFDNLTSKNNKREFLFRRLVIQSFEIEKEKEIIYGKKEYRYFPCDKNEILFNYNNNQFKINLNTKDGNRKKTFLKAGNDEVIIMDETNFIKNYNLNSEDFQKKKNNLSYSKKENNMSEKINEELNKIYEPLDNPIYNNKKEVKKDKNKSESIDFNSSSFIDSDSEDEVNSKIKFYQAKDSTNFIRYILCESYKKEIDGIFNSNQKINLNFEDKIELDSSLQELSEEKEKYNVNNDLSIHIIFKNFKGQYIEENAGMLIEIKKSFNLFDLLKQIKQDAKIINGLRLTNTNNIKLPNYILGIICSYKAYQVKGHYKRLKSNYKNEKVSILSHIMKIIDAQALKIIIGVIRNEKIEEYNLGIQDYEIPESNTNKRLDLQFLNKKVFKGNIKETIIETIIKKYKNQYKSLTYEAKYLISHSQYIYLEKERQKIEDENKNLKKKLEEEKKKREEEEKKREEEKKKREEEEKKMEEKMKKMEEKMKKMEEENKKMKKILEEEEEKKKVKELEKERNKIDKIEQENNS